MNKVSFQAEDDIKLTGILHLPQNTPDKAIVLAHGLTVDKDEDGIFIELANSLVNNGFTVLRFDFRGHGESGGDSRDMTVKGEKLDLQAAIELVESKNYERVGLVGASFGGGVATLYTASNQKRLKALCLWNPVLNYDHTFISPYLPWIVKRKGHIKKDMAEKGWSTIGSSNFKIGKNLYEEMKRVYPYEELKKITIPTLVIHGDKDRHVPYEDSKEYTKYLKNGEFITIKGGEHGFQGKKEWSEKAIVKTLKFFQKHL